MDAIVVADERARALRRNRTPAERKLWWRLRELKAHGFKFRQQSPIDAYVVDFVCLSHRLIVEVDGGTRSTPGEQAADQRRQRYLERQGFRVLRVTNTEVFEAIDGVMDVIIHHLETGSSPTESGSSPTPIPSPQGGGEE